MKKAADDLDEGSDPAGYRRAWEAVLAYAATIYPKGHPELAVIEAEFATAEYLQGNVQGALTRTEDLIARLKLAGPAYDLRVTDLMNGQLVMLMTLGRHDKARQLGADIVARRRAQYGGKPSSEVAAAYSNYANAEYEFGNYDKAIELVRQALTEAERLDPIPPNAAIWYSNLPVYLGGAGRTEEAIEAARVAAERLEKLLPAGHPFNGANLNTLAQLLLQHGRASEAETVARKAVDIAAARFGKKQQTAAYMSSLSQALSAQGKGEEARVVAEAAIAILEADLGPQADRTLVARETLAQALATQGDLKGALDLQKTLGQLRAKTLPPNHRDRIGGGDRLAQLAFRAGVFGEARTAQIEAQTLRRASLPPEDLSALAGEARLGAIEVRLGDKAAGSKRAASAAQALDRRLRQLTAAGISRSRRDQDLKAGYGWALDAAASAGDADGAFRLAQRFMMNSADRAAMDALARDAARDPAVAALLRERQDSAVELERLLDRHLRSAARGTATASLGDFEKERSALTARFDRSTAALQAAAPELLEMELPPALSLAAAQRSLRLDEALLVAAPGAETSTLFVVTRERAELVPIAADERRIAGLVRRIRSALDSGAAGAATPFDFAASAELHGLLLPEAVRSAIKAKPTLLVAASGSLSALPFAALMPSSSGKKWLIRDHAILVLPSVAGLARDPRSGERGKTKGSFVAIGAPLPAPAESAPGTPYGSASNSALVAGLAPLPASGPELVALGDALKAADRLVLTGSNATEAAVRKADLASAGIVAFATHGLLAGELDGVDEPALVLTPSGGDDGLLTASEIMRLRIGAEWVILSACNTAAGEGSGSGGLTGLARAFLHAGSRNLLASHWPVRDDAAAYLSVETVRGYRRGASPAQALRKAMLKMMDSSKLAGADHPALWAPFVLIGR
jgi:CHAT domain-containing protein/tetratricopeptide (TPR) repeat protein